MMYKPTGSRGVQSFSVRNNGQSIHSVPRHTQRGFTLLESLTALAIFAMALAALMELYTADVRVLGASRDYTHAGNLLQSLSATELSDPSKPIRSKRGAAGKFSWALETAPIAAASNVLDPGGPWALQHVRLTVRWPPARQVSITSVRMRPRDE